MPVHQIRPGARQVKLTFDDEPDPASTPALLDHLMALGLRATFFVLGHKIESPPGRTIVERMAAEGHRIGNHSYSDSNLTQRSAKQIEREITQTARLIGPLDGGIKLFRPPFGFHNAMVDEVVGALGYRLVLWNVVALDWKPFYSNRCWVWHGMPQIAANQDCVVLAHDVFPSTVAHVPALVAAIRRLPDTEFALLS
jgi:peptidoglycan/xylan/chitin deacetylase (PgdA/CDA1 family)